MRGNTGGKKLGWLFAVAIAWLPSASNLQAQSGSNYAFEVASIRPAATDARGTSIHTNPTGFQTRNTSLAQLIQFAYNVQPYQVTGGVGWVRDEHYDINAKYDNTEDKDIPPADQARLAARDERIRARLKNLLAERFRLKLLEETKELPVFGMTVDRGELKIKPTVNGTGSMNTNQNNGNGTMKGDGISLKRLAITLSGTLRRPVIDETGLDGLYDFQLTWSDSTNADAPGPSLFTALKEQLGLKLDSKKGPVVTYAIDRAEKASEN